MIRFLFKGLLRDPTRSRFPVMMVAAGAFLTVFLYGWMKGAISDLVKVNAQFDTGHVKVMTHAYRQMADQLPNDLALLGVDDLLGELRREHPDLHWTPRIRFGGLLDVPDAVGETREQGPVAGLGVDLLGADTVEPEILNLREALVRGRLPREANEVLISDAFATQLGVGPGDTATLLGSTMHGSMTMYNFKVAGTVVFGVTLMDRGALIADIGDIQAALDMPDGAGEIVGYRPDRIYADAAMRDVVDAFNRKRPDEDDEFSPVMLSLREQSGLADMLDLAALAGSIIVSIFALAMSIVLWNAALMNGLRRYGEIGVRLAMGEPKGTLVRHMILESILVGLVGSAIGTALGLGISFYLQIHGLDFSDLMKGSTMIFSGTMRAQVTGLSYVIGFLPGLLAPIVGTVLAGIGIYRRQTAQLFKELEV